MAGRVERSVSGHKHADERCSRGRQNRVVLTPRRWRQVLWSCVGPTGLRQNLSADDGGKRARSPGRARHKPLKPLRAGMSGDSGVLVVTRVRSTNTKCTRGCGCSGHPAFPTPSMGAEDKCIGSGASRREREVVCGFGFDVVAERKRPRLRHSGMVRRTRPQMRNCASGNLEIPGSMLRIAPE
jgi:hypothetical protein